MLKTSKRKPQNRNCKVETTKLKQLNQSLAKKMQNKNCQIKLSIKNCHFKTHKSKYLNQISCVKTTK